MVTRRCQLGIGEGQVLDHPDQAVAAVHREVDPGRGARVVVPGDEEGRAAGTSRSSGSRSPRPTSTRAARRRSRTGGSWKRAHCRGPRRCVGGDSCGNFGWSHVRLPRILVPMLGAGLPTPAAQGGGGSGSMGNQGRAAARSYFRFKLIQYADRRRRLSISAGERAEVSGVTVKSSSLP